MTRNVSLKVDEYALYEVIVFPSICIYNTFKGFYIGLTKVQVKLAFINIHSVCKLTFSCLRNLHWQSTIIFKIDLLILLTYFEVVYRDPGANWLSNLNGISPYNL